MHCPIFNVVTVENVLLIVNHQQNLERVWMYGQYTTFVMRLVPMTSTTCGLLAIYQNPEVS